MRAAALGAEGGYVRARSGQASVRGIWAIGLMLILTLALVVLTANAAEPLPVPIPPSNEPVAVALDLGGPMPSRWEASGKGWAGGGKKFSHWERALRSIERTRSVGKAQMPCRASSRLLPFRLGKNVTGTPRIVPGPLR